MAGKTGHFLDFSEFETKLKNLMNNTIPDAAEKGLFNAGNELIRDAKIKPPQAPFKKGDLHARGIVEKPKKTSGGISVMVGFNIKYAARHHEVPPGTYKYTLTHVKQPGPKFLESKMIQYKEKYMGIVAETIRRKGK